MGFRIENRVGVAAPPHVVWALVSNLEGWRDWTELYSDAGGRLAIGEKLHFTYKVGDRAPQSALGIVYDWVPEAQLAWRGSLSGGFVKSLRYVEIEKLTDTSCILANGEYYTGLLAGLIPRPLRYQVREGFERMNHNAKRICEAEWLAQGGTAAPASAGDIGRDETTFAIQPLMRPTPGAGVRYFGAQGRASLGPKLKRL
jgi:hypothetical protein